MRPPSISEEFMPVRIQFANARSGQELIEFTGTVYYACRNCREPNPQFVQCPRCETFNKSGDPCRQCGGPGGRPNPHWTACPRCGTKAVIERHRVYYHRDKWKRWRNDVRLWFMDLLRRARRLTERTRT
jgi:hypothetical protein